MKIILQKKPQNPVIVQGFPGFGFVGTVSTEFLISHLKAEKIGEFIYDELPVTAAIHQGELVNPMAVYYAKKYNMVILHTILNVADHEWPVAKEIVAMSKELKAKEIICLESVASPGVAKESKVYSFGHKDLSKIAEPLKEGIILGVTAALLLRHDKVTCFFAETHSNLPDSKAAAKIIEALDKYLNLEVPTEPLLQQAEEFEKKIKTIIQQHQKTAEEKERKDMSYLG